MKRTILFFTLALVVSLTTSAQYNTAEYLDINNVRARYMVHGDMFWDPAVGVAAYEFPKGSGKHSGFASSLWVGGIDQSTNNLKVAAQTYRSTGVDYWPGPLDEFNGATSNMINAAEWNQIWKVNQNAIDSFLSIQVHTIPNTPKSILEWPGRRNIFSKTPANTSLVVPDRAMAPFVDVNNDNIYNPLDGDYPKISGEQMLWWVFNDNTAPHPVSQTDALKIEIHASAYACNKLGLQNTTFLNYKIYNWSSSIIDSAVVGFWNDIDLGYAFDDFIGFDSTRRMGVTYNGDAFDETPTGYGASLTQKAAVILKQPGDATNYRSPVGAFTTHANNMGAYNSDPTIGAEFYYYMTGSWLDGKSLRKGCSMRDTLQPVTNYAYPDDPSIIGGHSQVYCNTVPFDRRFLLSSAPFQLVPGVAPLEFTFAFINTDTGVDNSNFNELRRLADSAYAYADGCTTSAAPLSVSRINSGRMKVYPNPALDGFFTLEDEDSGSKTILLYNSYGQVVLKKESQNTKTIIDTQSLIDGLYFLKITKDGEQYSQTVLIK